MMTLYSDDFHEVFPALQATKNNISVLLTLSPAYHGQTLVVLCDWIRSEESKALYQQLLQDVCQEQAVENYALTLAALLSRELLLPTKMIDGTSTKGSVLTKFKDILLGHNNGSNKEVFELMLLSLSRTLGTREADDGVRGTLRLISPFLYTDVQLPLCVDDELDQHCLERVRGKSHKEAFERTRCEFSLATAGSVEKADNAWVWVTSLDLAGKVAGCPGEGNQEGEE